ncbi:MAG: hypothetical protein ACHREM_01420 [Polyangiales bacterium]
MAALDRSARTSAVEDISLDDPFNNDARSEDAEPDHPSRVWVLFDAEQVPANGLDYRQASRSSERGRSLLSGAHDEEVRQLVRAVTLTALAERASIIGAMSTEQIGRANPQVAPTPNTVGHFSTSNLPPGVTARAFNDAVRKKRVPFAVIGGRNIVRATDWDAYVASLVKKASPVRSDATDDELLASVGRRQGSRK